MAIVTINYDGKSYDVQNDTSIQAIQYAGPIKTKRVYWRGYQIKKDDSVIYLSFYVKDIDLVDGYESEITRWFDFNLPLEPTYYTAGGNLKETEIKMLGVNEIFRTLFNIEPMNLNGTVKINYQ